MLVRYKDSNDRFVSKISPEKAWHESDEALYLGVAIQGHYINSHRTAISNTLFSLPYPGLDVSTLPMVRGADIINLHWVAYYQSPLTLKKLFDLGKPVVWTLHDQWAFTGGCHYAAGCEKYQWNCEACPQLADDPFNLPGPVLKDKLRYFENANLTIVAPSQWMGACAKKSRLFKNARVEVIPNALETDLFRPIPKAEAKQVIGLSPDAVTLLFGGECGNEKRKGFHKLVEAMKFCLKKKGFRELAMSNKIGLICFGHANDEMRDVGIPVKSLGYLASNEEIATAYCAADIFVLPSLEDNLPNTMLEAMSCGTPVVAFDAGGIPDAVKSGKTGQLVPLGDVKEMGKAILSLIFNPEQRMVMGKRCRRRAKEKYSLKIQANRYLSLYGELLKNHGSTAQPRAEDRSGGVWQVPISFKDENLPVTLETGVGPHLKGIYDQVLFKALKEFSCYAQREWDISEADRSARLKVIEQLKRSLGLRIVEQLKKGRRLVMRLVKVRASPSDIPGHIPHTPVK